MLAARWSVLATVLVAGVLALLATILALPASAHAGLVSIDPADGATVTAAPSRVTLTFDEDMAEPAVVLVTGPDGQRAAVGPARVSGAVVSVGVDLPSPGRYTVAFRAVSADGHPVTDQTSFAFQPGGVASAGSPAAKPGSVGGASASGATSESAWLVVGTGVALAALVGVGLVRALRANGDRAAP
jgi:methionine-rich copper-binding protein CopC